VQSNFFVIVYMHVLVYILHKGRGSGNNGERETHTHMHRITASGVFIYKLIYIIDFFFEAVSLKRDQIGLHKSCIPDINGRTRL